MSPAYELRQNADNKACLPSTGSDQVLGRPRHRLPVSWAGYGYWGWGWPRWPLQNVRPVGARRHRLVSSDGCWCLGLGRATLVRNIKLLTSSLNTCALPHTDSSGLTTSHHPEIKSPRWRGPCIAASNARSLGWLALLPRMRFPPISLRPAHLMAKGGHSPTQVRKELQRATRPHVESKAPQETLIGAWKKDV